MNLKLYRLSLILILGFFILVGCETPYEPNTKPGGTLEINKSEYDSKEHPKKNRNEPIENDIAEYITYDYHDRSIYIAGLKIFKEFSTEEFGYTNEGNATIIEDENALRFRMTTATGTITGALDGPCVYFKMNLDTNEIIEKEFKPAPNYAELDKTEFIEHSEEIIELTNERMVEIGLYFIEFIKRIEVNYDNKNLHVGYIRIEKNTLYLDEVEWITDENKDRIKELELSQQNDMPNGYYIYNPSSDIVSFEVNDKTVYNFIDWGNDFVNKKENRKYSTTNQEEFIKYLNTYSDKAAKVPFWIEVKDGYVINVTEQFLN